MFVEGDVIASFEVPKDAKSVAAYFRATRAGERVSAIGQTPVRFVPEVHTPVAPDVPSASDPLDGGLPATEGLKGFTRRLWMNRATSGPMKKARLYRRRNKLRAW